jgi:hypothetical protein
MPHPIGARQVLSFRARRFLRRWAGFCRPPHAPGEFEKKEICLLESSGGTGWGADDCKGNGAAAATRRPFSFFGSLNALANNDVICSYEHIYVFSYCPILLFSYCPIYLFVYDHICI